MTTIIQRKSDTIFLSLMTAMLCATGIVSTALAEDVYQLNATTTTGVDLTGYATDRMEGPSSANIEFSGSIVGASGTAESPFELIGMGRTITVTADNSSFHTLPLKLYNADGVSATSTLKFNAGSVFGTGALDVGSHTRFNFGYGANNGSDTIAYDRINIHDGGILDGYHLYFGKNNSLHISVTDGGKIESTTTYNIRFGQQTKSTDEPITVFLGITNASVSATGKKTDGTIGGGVVALMTGVPATDNTLENCRIVLGENGVLHANQIKQEGGGRSNIIFDGGRIQSLNNVPISTELFYVYGAGYASTWPNPHIWLDGINGNPIDIEVASDRMFAGGKASTSARLNVTGPGGFTKRGAGTLYFNRPCSRWGAVN